MPLIHSFLDLPGTVLNWGQRDQSSPFPGRVRTQSQTPKARIQSHLFSYRGQASSECHLFLEVPFSILRARCCSPSENLPHPSLWLLLQHWAWDWTLEFHAICWKHSLGHRLLVCSVMMLAQGGCGGEWPLDAGGRAQSVSLYYTVPSLRDVV